MKLRLIAAQQLLHRIISVLTLVVFALATTSSRTQTVFEKIIEDDVLRIITFVGPTTYFRNAKGDNGFEYFLARAFADSLGVRLEVSVIEDLDALLNALGGPSGHFAGAGLTITANRQQFIRFSHPYNAVRQTLVYHHSESKPKSIEDIIGGRIVVVANSSHAEHMAELSKQYPELQWQGLRDTEMLDLMQLVHEGLADYALVDSTAFEIDRSIYPKAQAAFDLTDEQAIAWAFPGHGDGSLLKAANYFLREFERSGQLQQLKAQFFGHTDEFSIGGSQLFMSRINQRLERYQPLFEEIAIHSDLDWRLLAAMAYQESHWDPLATSPTGVRGMMMLTLATASELNIDNRLDAKQSIRGGADYFNHTLKRIPEDIKEPDRTWMALAAYNIGLGHLEDARVLTDRAGDDPHLWRDVRKYLPLLLQKKHYGSVKHGYARGNEPVQYVQNIRHFRTILQWHGIQQARHNSSSENEPSTLSDFHSDLVLPL
jgi:membrane-bound lytic murein transglycosylase F